jgi:hypothetical protein
VLVPGFVKPYKRCNDDGVALMQGIFDMLQGMSKNKTDASNETQPLNTTDDGSGDVNSTMHKKSLPNDPRELGSDDDLVSFDFYQMIRPNLIFFQCSISSLLDQEII